MISLLATKQSKLGLGLTGAIIYKEDLKRYTVANISKIIVRGVQVKIIEQGPKERIKAREALRDKQTRLATMKGRGTNTTPTKTRQNSPNCVRALLSSLA